MAKRFTPALNSNQNRGGGGERTSGWLEEGQVQSATSCKIPGPM